MTNQPTQDPTTNAEISSDWNKPITITTPATKPLGDSEYPATKPLDELRANILTEFKQVHKLAPADYTENCTNVVMAMIEEHTANAEKQARIDELSQVSYIGGTLANKNQDILDRIQELENL